MAVLKIEGVTHWSIPVNDLNEAEEFYGELLGLEPKGRLGNSVMSCFNVGDHNILLCERSSATDGSLADNGGAHHSFTVSPEIFNEACRVFRQRGIRIDHLTYRSQGFFTGRELYFFDPAATGWNCETPPGQRGCLNPRSRNWPATRQRVFYARRAHWLRNTVTNDRLSNQRLRTGFAGGVPSESGFTGFDDLAGLGYLHARTVPVLIIPKS